MPFAAAISEHPVAADAVGEVLGELVEAVGTGPDLVVVFAGGAHAEFLGEVAAAVRRVLQPGTLLASSASSVLGGTQEAEDVPALSVLAARGLDVRPLRLTTGPVEDDGDGLAVSVQGVPTSVPDDAVVLLLADPASFPAEGFLDQLGAVRPDLRVVGGLSSTGRRGARPTLVLDDGIHHDGAVGVSIAGTDVARPVVSQGCRPVGEPMVVTRADGRFLLELAGRPALERLTDLAGQLDPEDRALLAGGVQLGVVIDEGRIDFSAGDFLVRPVLGADRAKGVLAVGSAVPVGTTVQFHVRDASSADADLRVGLARAGAGSGVEGTSGALVFTCDGRGRALFGTDDHDATAVAEALGTRAVAGMFCAGELGPVGGRSFVHGFTASVLVLADT